MTRGRVDGDGSVTQLLTSSAHQQRHDLKTIDPRSIPFCLALRRWSFPSQLPSEFPNHYSEGSLGQRTMNIRVYGPSNPIRTFTLGELQHATHNFDQRCRLDSRLFKHYLGILDDRQVVVKNANVDEYSAGGGGDDSLVEEHITEIVVLTSVRHRNIVRLLGCCLETRVPLLVYEFIPNGDLGYNLDRWRTAGPPPWRTRLQIAIDVANALSYLHCHNISRPIVHKNLKSETIILDEDNTAKLTGFRYSVSIPPDTTQVQEDGYCGTVSYLDPEYASTSTVTEKVDVYALGVLLLELMTGTSLFNSSYEPLFNMRAGLEGLRNPLLPHVEPLRTFLPEGEDSAKLYQLAVEEACLEKLAADASALQGSAGGNAEQVRVLAQLALKCAGPRMQQRPAMKEVAKELRRIGSMGNPGLGTSQAARSLLQPSSSLALLAIRTQEQVASKSSL
ncbi:hypothetical protein Taro_040260 [Colocasia esculenta]|uniref:Protein kinase domain-containing protein n=1 Tax=Colocasia esculenta TaxID=4460 RepID=A0A843WU03_COLES|nr:hypothetical protein [Colocasia esculenta]